MSRNKSEIMGPRPKENQAWKMPDVNLELLVPEGVIKNNALRLELLNYVTRVRDRIKGITQIVHSEDAQEIESMFDTIDGKILAFAEFIPQTVKDDLEAWKREMLTYVKLFNTKNR